MDSVAGAGTSLLVVEDGVVSRKVLADLLRWEGYEVASAADGRQALDLLRRGPVPDLILLDLLMPFLDGWGFLELLQAEPALVGVPVIIVTGTMLTREWAQAHGCAGYVSKPIQVEELITEIRRCLGGSRAVPRPLTQ